MQLRLMRQGESHQGVTAPKVELFTDVAAVRFDGGLCGNEQLQNRLHLSEDSPLIR